MKQALLLLISLNCYLLGIIIALNPATAQVVPDGTTNTTVDAEGNNITINDGDRAGNNLFHSFQDFSVPDGGSALFNNEQAIENIFSRVTGGNISNIDGILGANGSANLFLVNPAGIIFGENASLSVGGSFYGTSADSILFEDGEFSATDLNNSPLLTINAPIGLSFRDNPGDIINRSTSNNDRALTVNAGESISLIGGNVTLNGGQILAPGARVNLGGLTATGTIELDNNGGFSFPENVARGNVSITNSSRIFVASDGGGSVKIDARNFELASDSFIAGGIANDVGTPNAQAGDIIINATEDVVIDATESNGSTTINNSNFGVGNAGNVDINARNISFVDGGAITSFSNGLGNSGNITLTATEDINFDGIFQNQTSGIVNSLLILQDNDSGVAEQTGIPGTTNIIARNLTLTNGAQISSINSGVGDSGNINIDVIDSININGEGELLRDDGTSRLINSEITTSVFGSGTGNTGDVNISTNNLSLTNGGAVSSDSFGRGNAGDINIAAQTINIDGLGRFQEIVDDSGQVSRLASQSSISSETLSTLGSTIIDDGIVAEGNGGTITINTDSLSITNGGDISTNIGGIGNAGDIEITAKTIDLDGQGFFEIVDNSGQISPLGVVSSISSEVVSDPNSSIISQGNGGNITINTNSLSLTNGASVDAGISGMGNGGNIVINAQENTLIQGTGTSTLNGETINLSSGISALLGVGAVGNGGNVEINTVRLSVIDDASISVTTLGEGNAGNLIIEAPDSIELLNDSSILANVAENATGNSGEVDINTGNLSISDNSQIQTASIGTGEAGNLRIDANSINLDNMAGIDASTPIGNGGNITLNVTEDITLSNNSLISAEASNEANGGNVNIDTNFIVAFPNQDSDIIATAEQGDGGNISISAQALFGIEEREALADNVTNDIDASSEFGLTGTVSINTPDLNPIQGATELSSNFIQSEQTVAQACAADQSKAEGSELLVTGKGGVPSAPDLPFDSEGIVLGGELFNPYLQHKTTDHEVRSSSGSALNREEIVLGEELFNPQLQNATDNQARTSVIKSIPTAKGNIIPARGIKLTKNGDVILTAYQTQNKPRTPIDAGNCVSQAN
ncbi:filamentous hemagglutinin N-terminal domain-containing protein [Pleurocapsa sp. PCC 7319]|uniref:two-partner secretion domain-containing protein n=1 Tax=Pleurocapsa sp. PCC 7319 TaxID=118161 RepID=UPI000344A3A4|nr:filamentous hemagglutinin N-terminal domain-containing protein [Pleurocapsa sp. PCC 7319]